ncbi:MAG: hypothetical protein GXO64_04860 [Candidatus Micrarchaeota archaeon]|nr:hypothetical protein [Candidatus Micrarchaeota archaeon]
MKQEKDYGNAFNSDGSYNPFHNFTGNYSNIKEGDYKRFVLSFPSKRIMTNDKKK